MKMKAHLEFQKMVIKWNYFLQMSFVLMSMAKLQAEKSVPQTKRDTVVSSKAELRQSKPLLEASNSKPSCTELRKPRVC